MEEEHKQRLISESSDSLEDALYQFNQRHSRRRWSLRLLAEIGAGILLLLSLFENTILWRAVHSSKTKAQDYLQRKDGFSGILYDTYVEYSTESPWASTNETEADELWESLDTSPVTVALSDEWALEHGLPLASRFPWEDGVGMYHIKAFHHMHCLKNFRRAYLDQMHGRPSTISYAHFMHCLNSLRQDMMCTADDTLMPGHPDLKHHIGEGQMMQCRNWDALVAWSQAPERSSCFRMLSDYRPVPNTIEEFAFCPPGSSYKETADAYFAEHGHGDPWNDEIKKSTGGEEGGYA